MEKFFPLFAIFSAIISVQSIGQTPIDPLLFGQNYWFGNPVGMSPQLFSAAIWSKVKEANVRSMRWGGIAINKSGTRPEKGAYLTAIHDIRSNNCEPILQVPFHNDYNTFGSVAEQAAEAGEIVNFVNNIHKQRVVYWACKTPSLSPDKIVCLVKK